MLDSHGSHYDSHGSHYDSHGSHYDSHGSHYDSHGSHYDSHGSHYDSHGSHYDSHGSHYDSHGSLARMLVKLVFTKQAFRNSKLPARFLCQLTSCQPAHDHLAERLFCRTAPSSTPGLSAVSNKLLEGHVRAKLNRRSEALVHINITPNEKFSLFAIGCFCSLNSLLQ